MVSPGICAVERQLGSSQQNDVDRRRIWGKTVVRVWGKQCDELQYDQPLGGRIWGKQRHRIGGGISRRIIGRMTHERRIPGWLLRDLSALVGLFASFWLFVVPLIAEGVRLIAGGRHCQEKVDALARLLVQAEASLAWALWREAHRRLGFDHRRLPLSPAELPPSHDELMERIRSYLDQVQNLSRVAAYYTDQLRRRWGAASVSAPAARGATPAAGQRASARAPSSLSPSVFAAPHAMRVATAVGAHARGPPPISCKFLIEVRLPQRAVRLGSRARVLTRSRGAPGRRGVRKAGCPARS